MDGLSSITKVPKVDVKELFRKIGTLCQLPSFPRLEPLNKFDFPILSPPSSLLTPPPSSASSDVSSSECAESLELLEPPSPRFDLLRGLRSKSETPPIDPTRILPKTREEVETLFTEIRDFMAFDLPFKLADLDESDKIKSPVKQEPPPQLPVATIEKRTAGALPVTRRRVARRTKCVQSSTLDTKENKTESFFNLMFNFSSTTNTDTSSKPTKAPVSKTYRVRSIAKVKEPEVKKPIISTPKIPPPPPLRMSNPLLGLDLKSRVESYRNLFNSVKQSTPVTTTTKVTKSNSQKPPKEPTTRKRKGCGDESVRSRKTTKNTQQLSQPQPEQQQQQQQNDDDMLDFDCLQDFNFSAGEELNKTTTTDINNIEDQLDFDWLQSFDDVSCGGGSGDTTEQLLDIDFIFS